VIQVAIAWRRLHKPLLRIDLGRVGEGDKLGHIRLDGVALRKA
jgi:hypothetical protein